MNSKLIREVKNIITKAGDIAIRARKKGLDISIKSDESPVTNADKAISDFIFTHLSKIDNSLPVICEERAWVDVNDCPKFWLVDPIDGTRSYIKNSDYFTVNIALIENHVAKYGFIYLPSQAKLYYTDENQKFLIEQGGKIIAGTPHQSEEYIAVVSSYSLNLKTRRYLEKNRFNKIIAMPSSLKLCLIAEGAGDVYPKFGDTMEWDIAAGHAIVKASGGDVFDLSGNSIIYGKSDLLNPHFIAVNNRFLARFLEKTNARH